VLRQVLKRARLSYRFVDDYVTLRNQKPPVGTALTSDEQQRRRSRLAGPRRARCFLGEEQASFFRQKECEEIGRITARGSVLLAGARGLRVIEFRASQRANDIQERIDRESSVQATPLQQFRVDVDLSAGRSTMRAAAPVGDRARR
jgi:hypothetical protein